MARIVAGVFKGQRLTVPKHIRPTEEKVRQALFNILGAEIVGARVLDAFAGSGALGLEALSRGAKRVVFLESHPACARAIHANLARLVDTGEKDVEAVCGDALRSLQALARRQEVFDVILLDPPYQGAWGKKALNVAATCGILAPTGVLCFEHARQNEVPSSVGPLTFVKQHRYGDTVLSFYRSVP